MSLKDVLCQNNAIEVFQRSSGLGRVCHAYIFAGVEGVGKFKMAREWAKALLCQNSVQETGDGHVFYDSCGVCESCLLFEGQGHPDFKHIYKELIKYTSDPGNRSKTPVDLPKDVIQEFLVDQVANKPKVSDRVIYIVDEAQRLNTSSQNLLLKTLEEPPAHCVIILLCTRLDKLVPTILSRCQVVRFGPIDEQIIIETLSQKGCQPSQGLFWARFTDGSLGESLTYASVSADSTSAYDVKRSIVQMLAELRLEQVMVFSEELAAQSKLINKGLTEIFGDISSSDLNRRALKFILRVLMSVFSDAMKLALDSDSKYLVNEDQKNLISIIAQLYGAENSVLCVKKAYESMQWVDASVNERLIFDEILLKLVDFATI